MGFSVVSTYPANISCSPWSQSCLNVAVACAFGGADPGEIPWWLLEATPPLKEDSMACQESEQLLRFNHHETLDERSNFIYRLSNSIRSTTLEGPSHTESLWKESSASPAPSVYSRAAEE